MWKIHQKAKRMTKTKWDATSKKSKRCLASAVEQLSTAPVAHSWAASQCVQPPQVSAQTVAASDTALLSTVPKTKTHHWVSSILGCTREWGEKQFCET